MKKNNKGITLIALIITIIIMLILAGVTILQLTGNGLFSKAQIAKEETLKKEASEIINLKITEIQIQGYAENKEMPKLQYVADKLCENKDNDIEYVETVSKLQSGVLPQINVVDGIFVKLSKYPYEFGINENLQLDTIDGVKVASNNKENQTSSTESKIINEYNIQTLEVRTCEIKIGLVENITTTNNSEVKGYIIMVDNKVRDISQSMPYTIKDLESDEDYNIQVIAIDEDANLKRSTNVLKERTLYIMEITNLNLIDVKNCSIDESWARRSS